MSTNALPFEELYATYYPHIYRHVYRLVRQHEQAEDLTQTAFLNAWRAWSPASEGNLTGWLYTIATHVALDALAHKRLLSFQSLDVLVEWLEETASAVREDEVCLERLMRSDNFLLIHAPFCSFQPRATARRNLPGHEACTRRHWHDNSLQPEPSCHDT